MVIQPDGRIPNPPESQKTEVPRPIARVAGKEDEVGKLAERLQKMEISLTELWQADVRCHGLNGLPNH